LSSTSSSGNDDDKSPSLLPLSDSNSYKLDRQHRCHYFSSNSVFSNSSIYETRTSGNDFNNNGVAAACSNNTVVQQQWSIVCLLLVRTCTLLCLYYLLSNKKDGKMCVA